MLGLKRKREYNIYDIQNKNQKPMYEINDSNIKSDFNEIQIKEEINYGKMIEDIENNLSTFYSINEFINEQQVDKNKIDNEKKTKNEVHKENINENLLKIYFTKNNNSIFYGIPIGSNIKFLGNNTIVNPNSSNSKQYFIIGKKVLNFNKDFKYEFILEKVGKGISIGLININLAIKHNFKFQTVHNKCSILISSSTKIYNYFENNKNIVLINNRKNINIQNIILEFDSNNSCLKFICLGYFINNIYLDMENIKNEEFRIGIFFRGINSQLYIQEF